ncbi:MAG: hypothetical protein WEB53_06995 [Akkermansiaceae bacterium]
MRTALIICALANSAFAGTPDFPSINPQSLTKLQQGNPIAHLETPAEGTAINRQMGLSIIKQSMILNDGENWTLVPKDAVIFIPETLAGRANLKPVGRLLAWADFLTQNQGWITTRDVSFDQAVGNESVPSEHLKFWAKQDKIVIAVHQNKPISVRLGDENQAITQR